MTFVVYAMVYNAEGKFDIALDSIRNAFEKYLTSGRFVYGSYQIKNCRFTCAIWPNQADNFSFMQRQVEVWYCFQPAEVVVDIVHFK